jgi:CBS domain-containing protein
MRYLHEIVRHQEPLVLPPDATVQDACRSMRDRRVGAVLVAERDGRLVGIFTGRDAICRVLAEARNAAETTLAEVMTGAPDTLPPGCFVIEALRLMQDGGYRHLPLVEQGGRLAGIVSRTDFLGLEQDRLEEETRLWERV